MNKLLTQVRRITLLLFALTICAGFFVGKITGEQVMAITGIVIGFYFGQNSSTQPSGDNTVANPKQ